MERPSLGDVALVFVDVGPVLDPYATSADDPETVVVRWRDQRQIRCSSSGKCSTKRVSSATFVLCRLDYRPTYRVDLSHFDTSEELLDDIC